MSASNGKGVVLLGSTSAIGRALACEYARLGYDIVLGARDVEENEIIARDIRIRHQREVHTLEWQASDFDTHEKFFADCREALGERLDGIIVCSGYMTEQSVAQTDWESARQTIDVNYTGCVSILNLFANLFEERKQGFIVGVSSVSGDRGRQSIYIYGSSKAAFTTYLDGLRNRLYHSGVHVTTLKPGFVDTKMTWGKEGMFLVASPESAARHMAKGIEKKKNIVYTPWFWRYIMLIIRHVPEWQFKKMRM